MRSSLSERPPHDPRSRLQLNSSQKSVWSCFEVQVCTVQVPVVGVSSLAAEAWTGVMASAPRPSAAAPRARASRDAIRSEEHTSELQSLRQLVCRLLLEKKKNTPTLMHVDESGTSDQADYVLADRDSDNVSSQADVST